MQSEEILDYIESTAEKFPTRTSDVFFFSLLTVAEYFFNTRFSRELKSKQLFRTSSLLRQYKDSLASVAPDAAYFSSLGLDQFEWASVERLDEQQFRNLCSTLIRGFLFGSRRTRSFALLDDELNSFLVRQFGNLRDEVIYMPACGPGTTFLHFTRAFPSHSFYFIGQEIDSQTRHIALVNLISQGILVGEIRLENSLLPVPETIEGRAGICIGMMPMHPSYRRANPEMENTLSSRTVRVSDMTFIDNVLSSLNEQGRAAVIVNSSYLSSDLYMKHRESLVRRGWIRSIIALPPTVFDGSSKQRLSVVILDKNPSSDSRFVNFQQLKSDFSIEVQSDIERVLLARNRFLLNVNRYANEYRKRVREVLVSSPYPIISLDQITASALLGVNYSPKRQISRTDPEAIPYVRIVDLSKNNVFNLDLLSTELILEA